MPAPARRGLLLPRDLRAHGLVVHEGQPLPDRGPARVPGAPGRHRVGGRVRAAGARSCLRSPTARPGPADLAALRPHLRDCPACRARLREYRAVPGRVAALVPGGGAPARRPPRPAGPVRVRAGRGVQDRAAALGERGHQAVELVAGQKVAAVATSAAIASGGGVAAERLATHAPADAARPGRAAKAPERRRSPAARAAARRGGPRAGAPAAARARRTRPGSRGAGSRRRRRRRRPVPPRPSSPRPAARRARERAPRDRPPRPRRRAGAASSPPSGPLRAATAFGPERV